MTNKTITLSRELAELCYRALNGGENQLTGMEHGRAFRELSAAMASQHVVCGRGILCQDSKCDECSGNGSYIPPLADPVPPAGDWAIDTTAGRPILVYQGCSVIEAEQAYYVLGLINGTVPPAGGEVEVIAWLYDDGEGTRGVTDRWDVAKHTPSVVAQLVDRAHVTRLQAEVEDLRRRCTHVNSQLVSTKFELEETRDAYLNQSSRLVDSESELTKALELLKEADNFMYIMTGHDSHARLVHQYGKEWWTPVNELRGKICTALSNQSAPADKGVI